MNNTLNLIRAARGPVQLIVLGILFILGYSQIAPVWQTWPVLLISFGLMKLLEWLYQRSLPTETAAGGGGGYHA
ncbi:MAG: hypothetical protein IT169_19025 [Bryobacterales bacterium]|nr:hypothetical protein [Bryobacterales bacterium]